MIICEISIFMIRDGGIFEEREIILARWIKYNGLFYFVAENSSNVVQILKFRSIFL